MSFEMGDSWLMWWGDTRRRGIPQVVGPFRTPEDAADYAFGCNYKNFEIFLDEMADSPESACGSYLLAEDAKRELVG